MDDGKPYHHGNLKAALVAHGLTLLEEVGPAALSLRAIAARAGVSHAAPRNHFGSLRGLLTAIAAEGFRRHARAMRAGTQGTSEREAKLMAAMEGYVGFAAAHPHLFDLMFSSDLCDMSDPELQAAGAESYGVLREIARGLDWAHSEAPDADRRAEVYLWSMVHGFAQLQAAGLLSGHGPAAALPIAAIMPRLRYRPVSSPEPDASASG